VEREEAVEREEEAAPEEVALHSQHAQQV